MGLKELNWLEIKRCFKDLENYRYPHAHPSRGKDGPVEIAQALYSSPVVEAILQTGEQFRPPRLADINRPKTDGMGYTHVQPGCRATRTFRQCW
jgi:choline dehydrogenase